MPFSPVSLSNGLAVGASVVVAYPAGVTQTTAVPTGNTFAAAGSVYRQDTAFTLVLDASTITLTWLGPSALPRNTMGRLHIDVAPSTPAILHDLPGKAIADDYPSIDRTGAQDTAALVNDCIVAYTAQGNPVAIGAGRYRCNSSIILRTGLRLICSPNAVIRAHFGTTQNHFLVGVPSVAGALDPATRQRDIYIEGGVWGLDGQLDGDGAWTSNRTCTVFNVFADDLRLHKVEVNGFGQGRAFQLCGDRVIGSRCNTYNPVRTGGAGSIRYIGGTYFRWSDGHSEAGDDCFMLVPGGTATGTNWNNRTIEDAQYINCTYKSWTARGMVVGLEGTSGAMTASIRRFAYIGVRGVGGGSSLSIQNRDSSGEIADGDFIGCVVDDTDNEDRPSAVNITGWRMPGQTSGGGIRNMRFFGLDIHSCHRLALDISGYVDGVYFYGGTWAKAREQGLQAVRVRGAHGGGLYNVVINGDGTVQPMVFGAEDALSTGPGVTPGSETPENSFQIRRSVENFRVRDCDIRDVPDGTHAVQVTYTDDLQITSNKVRKLDGATTARAVNFAATAENCLVDHNDFSECGHATPISDVGTGNTIGTNLGTASGGTGDTLDSQSAAGGSLAWEPGLTVIRITEAGTVASITGTPTYPAELTLRAVHSSGTLVIDHIANVIRLKGLADLTLATNDALTLVYDTANGYWFEKSRSVA